jgi:PAS domain S-box-containing protein
MTPFLIAQLLAAAGLVAFWSLHRLHPSQTTRYWLFAWTCMVGSGMLLAGSARVPNLEPLVALLATMGPFFLLGGALALREQRAPATLLAGGGVIAIGRAVLMALERDGAAYAVGVTVTPAIFAATSVVLWRRLREGEPSRYERIHPWAIGAMGVVSAALLGGRLVGVDLAKYAAPLLLVFGGLAVCLQMLIIVGQARSREDSLTTRNARLAGVVERSAQLIAWARPDGRLRYINPELRRTIGAEGEADLAKMNVWDFFSSSERQRIEEECLPAVKRIGFWQGETSVETLDGKEVPVWLVAMAEFAESEEIQAIYCIMTDLSERRRAREALRRRYDFEHLIASLSTYFVRLDPHQIDLGINAALREIGEFAEADRSFIIQFREDGKLMDNTHEWCAPGVASYMERFQGLPVDQFRWSLDFVQPGGILNIHSIADLPPQAETERGIWESVGARSAMAVPLSLGTQWIGALGLVSVGEEKAWSNDDLSLLQLGANLLTNAIARKRAAQMLDAREAELRQSQKMEAVGRLAGGVAHDFNNLLTVISGYGRLLVQSFDEDDPRRASADEILRASKRATTLTTQLLSFSHRQVLQARSFDLSQCAQNLEEMLRPLIGEHITFETHLDSTLPPVHADPSQIEQVIVNLVVNARDAMPKGGTVTVTTELVELRPDDSRHPATLDPGLWARVSVSDTGTGIDPEIRSQIFEPFFTTKAPGKGTGLGLSLVYGVVNRSGGAVQLQSAEGQGTTVEVYLPLSDERTEEIAEPAPVARTEGVGGRATILLVEDEDMVRALAGRTLMAAGHTVLEARDGKEALAVAESAGVEIDALVTDIVIPYLSGPELAERLRRDRPHLRVMFTSGYPRHIGGGAISLPPDSLFLKKPFDAEMLIDRIDELLSA